MPACLGTDRTGAIEFRLLTDDRIEDVLIVQQLSMRQECIAIGMGMYEDFGASEEMQLVFREVIKDGCTVIAIDRSDRIVAVAFNKLCASIKNYARPLNTDMSNRYESSFLYFWHIADFIFDDDRLVNKFRHNSVRFCVLTIRVNFD
ncbi:hypothetical protein P5V15_008559 [Pogonomyrmex californicus]